MQEFIDLIAIADRLLGPKGCSWDKAQTLFTLQPYLLEEMHELIEAIDFEEGSKISEELGDVFYALVFVAKLGEINKNFSLRESLRTVCEKLIRRHPHVFGNIAVSSNEEIARNWEEIKKQERGTDKDPGLSEGIPPSLPALARAQKMAKRWRKLNPQEEIEPITDEQELGQGLWNLIQRGEKGGIDAESALRRTMQSLYQF
jgi:MazG family protein